MWGFLGLFMYIFNFSYIIFKGNFFAKWSCICKLYMSYKYYSVVGIMFIILFKFVGVFLWVVYYVRFY